ncbi:Ada metal-binding domain-containing protein [Methanobacterium sp.]|uniref:Ada metal-binding domain-containing protein n=1 Tax=Methanobacterium sp. TaxID=2164 RepID=UPI003D64875B
MDKRIIALFGVLVLAVFVMPNLQNEVSTTSEVTINSISKITVNAAYKGNYVGSINSNVYHKSYCRYVKKIKSYNKIYFKSKAQARTCGYRPCKVCRP